MHNNKESHFIQSERTRNKDQKRIQNNQKTLNKMAISIYVSVITLNVNGLNAPIKRHRVTEWMKKKTRSIYMLPRRDSLQTQRHTQTKSKGMEKHILCK